MYIHFIFGRRRDDVFSFFHDAVDASFWPYVAYTSYHSVVPSCIVIKPSFSRRPCEKLSYGILMLVKMIAKNGDPEAIYVDHGKQFKSDGDRLNNFNFFCAAHLLVRVKLEADPNYSLAQLNRDLEAQNEKEWSIR